MNPTALEELAHDDLYEHLYSVYTEHRPAESQHLGYVDKSREKIDISLPLSGIDVVVQQSLSSLSSATQTSSTGFICWQTASHFADWAAADPRFPIKDLHNCVVLELGGGASGLLAAVLGPRSCHYVATDQSHVVKLMKHNFAENVVSQRFTSSTVEKSGYGPRKELEESWGKIDIIPLDWENPMEGKAQFCELTGQDSADYIFACDTIYNTYLIPHFLSCMGKMMSNNTVAVVAMQLRDEDVTAEFLDAAFVSGFRVSIIKDEFLTPVLIQGFVLYCFQK
ncbi:hypothetical protein OXX80_010739 [Metschnikowia pulcherrima]